MSILPASRSEWVPKTIAQIPWGFFGSQKLFEPNLGINLRLPEGFMKECLLIIAIPLVTKAVGF
jgi:hypothetical protein